MESLGNGAKAHVAAGWIAGASKGSAYGPGRAALSSGAAERDECASGYTSEGGALAAGGGLLCGLPPAHCGTRRAQIASQTATPNFHKKKDVYIFSEWQTCPLQ